MTASHPPWEAFADPTRRAILRLLGERGELAAGAIATELTMVGRSAVSAQLRVLRSAGLVAERRSGRHRIYAIQPGAAGEIQSFLDSLYGCSPEVSRLRVATPDAYADSSDSGVQTASGDHPTGGLSASTRLPGARRRQGSEPVSHEADSPGSESESGRKPTAFADADEVYTYLGGMFSRAVQEPSVIAATKDSDLVVLLTQISPKATILIDFPGQKVVCGDAAAGAIWTVHLHMSSANSNRFWQGRLNLTLAMAQRKVKLDGKRSVALKLLRLTESLFAAYRQTLRDAGREDLLA